MRRLGLLALAGALACQSAAPLPDTLVLFAERDVEGLDLHSRRPELGYGIFNLSYDENPMPGLDAAIEDARHQLDPPRRLLALQAVMRQVLDSHLPVPLLQEADIVFTSPDVEWKPRTDTFRLVAEARFKPEAR